MTPNKLTPYWCGTGIDAGQVGKTAIGILLYTENNFLLIKQTHHTSELKSA